MVTPTVLEKENADRLNGNIYSSTLPELLHKFMDCFVNPAPLFLREREDVIKYVETEIGEQMYMGGIKRAVIRGGRSLATIPLKFDCSRSMR